MYLVDHDNCLQNLVTNSQMETIVVFLHLFSAPAVRLEFTLLATIFKIKLLRSAESVDNEIYLRLKQFNQSFTFILVFR